MVNQMTVHVTNTVQGSPVGEQSSCTKFMIQTKIFIHTVKVEKLGLAVKTYFTTMYHKLYQG